MPTVILGLSAYYHDSAAALIVNGEVVAAAQEERFSRLKHDARFPHGALRYVLDEAGVTLDDLAAVAYYEKPLLKFERLMETCHAVAPRGLRSFLRAMPAWMKQKLFLRRQLQRELGELGGTVPKILFPEHHLSHAASAFYPSPFQDAAILTIDGVGEWACSTIGHGSGNALTVLKEQAFPHSLGLFYSAFTHYCGFPVNDGEYKLMGLAPYGRRGRRVEELKALILDRMLDLRPDGSFALNMRYFDFAAGLTMTRDVAWQRLFGMRRRLPEGPLDGEQMDLALAAQEVTDEVVLRMARTARDLTGSDNLALAGGVALNCVSNGKIAREGIFRNLWVQPAAGDAGGALGAALAAWHVAMGGERIPARPDGMKGALLGPEFTEREVTRMLAREGALGTRYQDAQGLCAEVARLLSQGKVVGWFQGRMEYGPRALGNRSILADPRLPGMQQKLNLKIKFREGFRPFAPSVLLERAADYFECEAPSPYMLQVVPLRQGRRLPVPEEDADRGLAERLRQPRSDIPAVTHVDFSARVQTVDPDTNPLYRQLLQAFLDRTGCPVLVNTSFNVRGEPIVCTPADAYRCFLATDMDYLALGNVLLEKRREETVE